VLGRLHPAGPHQLGSHDEPGPSRPPNAHHGVPRLRDSDYRLILHLVHSISIPIGSVNALHRDFPDPISRLHRRKYPAREPYWGGARGCGEDMHKSQYDDSGFRGGAEHDIAHRLPRIHSQAIHGRRGGGEADIRRHPAVRRVPAIRCADGQL
jgi:hypothetical protein